MSQIDQLMRCVAEVDGPNLLSAFDTARAQLRAEQGRAAMAGFWRAWGTRPGVIRQMLRHERPTTVRDFLMVAAFLGLSLDEASALWLANAPAAKVAAVMQSYWAARAVEQGVGISIQSV